MLETKGTNVEAADKQRIHNISASQILRETQPNLQNVKSLDPSKVSPPTGSKYH